MRKRSFFVVFSAIVFLFCSCTHMTTGGHPTPSNHLTQIIQRGELVVGTSGNMPPLNMIAKNGEVIGFEMDIARLMAEEMGVELKIKAMPFHELLPALELNKVDLVMSGMTITPSRNLRFAFAGPYLASGKAFLAKSETIANVKDAMQIDSPTTRITALKGSTSQEFVETVMPKAQLMATDNYNEAVQLVLHDKAHAMVADFPICVVAILRYPHAGFVSVRTTLTYEPYGIALPPDDAHVMNWVENFLHILEEGGKLESLKDKWFRNRDWMDRIW
jgi:polar amino acid transport system substrate-binding protein